MYFVVNSQPQIICLEKIQLFMKTELLTSVFLGVSYIMNDERLIYFQF